MRHVPNCMHRGVVRSRAEAEPRAQLIDDAQGNPQNVRVIRHAGMGLDEKAIEAVRQYRFKSAIYEGHPIAAQLVIEVDFHLH